MNCHEFEDRFHQLADDRLAPHQDALLQSHADECDDCAELLIGWEQIDSALLFSSVNEPEEAIRQQSDNSQRDQARRVTRTVQFLASIAAALFLVVTINGSKTTNNNEVKTTVVLQPEQATVVTDQANQWWNDIQPQTWLAQTMPAVQSVRDGVAPIGRSVRQAVLILTSSGNRTS